MDNNEKKSLGKLEVKAKQSFTAHNEMYKIVNFLNENLKEKKLIFGLTKDSEDKMSITIYEI